MRRILLAVLILITSLTLATQVMAFDSNPLDQACSSSAKAQASATCKQATAQGTTDPIAGPGGIISKTADIIALVAGIAAVILIIISGFRFITAGGIASGQRSGDPTGVKNARATLTAALIGLVVIVLSWAIVSYVTDNIIR